MTATTPGPHDAVSVGHWLMANRPKSMSPRAVNARIAEARRKRYGDVLEAIPRDEWPTLRDTRAPALQVWCSRRFIAVLYQDPHGERFSVCRAELDERGRYKDGITWDELMRLKREAGMGDRWAVEVYPPDSEVVNVSNMRHLWVLNKRPETSWTNNAAQESKPTASHGPDDCESPTTQNPGDLK